MELPSWLIIVVALGTFTILNVVTYAIAAALGHVRALLPFISFTGILGPENGIFVINFAVTSFLLSFVVYGRFLHAHYTVKSSLLFRIVNFTVLIIGLGSLFANLCIAAFEADDAYWPHYIAAILTIFLNYVYALAQSFIGLGLPPRNTVRKWIIFAVQLSMTIFGFIVFVYFFISGYIYPTTVYVAHRDNFTAIANMSDLVAAYNQGLTIDYTRALAEWILLVEILAFYLTFIPDFSRIRLRIAVDLRHEEDKLPGYVEDSKPL